MRYLIIFVFVFSLGHLYAQEDASISYKEDQFYIDINFPIQRNSISGFEQNGFSRSIHLGYLNDLLLTPKGDKAVAIGLGYGFMRLVNNLNLREKQGELVYTLPTNNLSLRNVFSYHQIQLPVEFRWRTSTPEEHAFWRIYLGYRLSYQFGGRYNPFFGSPFSLSDQLAPIQHSFSLSAGFNTWNLRLEYGITPFLKNAVITADGRRPRIYPVQIGMIFYIL